MSPRPSVLPAVGIPSSEKETDNDKSSPPGPIGPLPEGIEAHPIVVEPLIVAAPEGHRAAGGDSVRFADLADEDFLAFADPPGVGLGRVPEDLAREAGFRPKIAQRVSERSAMLGMIAAGIGVGPMANAVRFLRMPGVKFLFCACPASSSSTSRTRTR